jgi:hypothetical protein
MCPGLHPPFERCRCTTRFSSLCEKEAKVRTRTDHSIVLPSCRRRLCLLSCEFSGQLGLLRVGLATVLQPMYHVGAECVREIGVVLLVVVCSREFVKTAYCLLHLQLTAVQTVTASLWFRLINMVHVLSQIYFCTAQFYLLRI